MTTGAEGPGRYSDETAQTLGLVPVTHEIKVVINTEANPPQLLGVMMPRWHDDEDIVRYHDTGPDEEEHIAPADCVEVHTIRVTY